MFRVRAGRAEGLPSPGRSTLTQLPSGDFAVDSFFDITYEIEFEGCPDSPYLAGMSGTTAGRVRIQQGNPVPGDFDEDGDVDLDDYLVFANCMAGPDAVPSPTQPYVTAQGCRHAFDLDVDDDVDLADFAGFQMEFTGS
jgi:hypothetical protein